jgi:hypothetical protein
MTRIALLLGAAAVLAATPATALENGRQPHATPSIVPYPVPTGTPDAIIGGGSHEPFMLRFAIMNGKRVLYDMETGEVVYVLMP